MFNSQPLYYFDVLNTQQLTWGFRCFITTTNRTIKLAQLQDFSQYKNFIAAVGGL